jgi:hypothetical protein
MKLKILLLVAGVAVIGSSVTVLVIQSHSRPLKFPPPESELPAAISNYSKTFKLNTSPPIWAQPQKQGATNGSH